MLSPNHFDKIYLYRPHIDFRRGIMGLALIIQDEMELNPFEKTLFLFCNKQRNKLKAIFWDRTGFVMWYKILEKDRFKWPSHLNEDNIAIDINKLRKFLNGLNPWQLPHQEIFYKKV